MAYPTFLADGSTPRRSDTQHIVLLKILGQVNNLLALFSPVTAQPSFFSTGTTPVQSDTNWVLLQKINAGLRMLEEAITAAGTGGTPGIFTVALITNLRAVATVASNKIATVAAGTVAGDGMGGLYYWLAGNTDADDGIATIRPNDYTTGGTWKKLV